MGTSDIRLTKRHVLKLQFTKFAPSPRLTDAVTTMEDRIGTMTVVEEAAAAAPGTIIGAHMFEMIVVTATVRTVEGLIEGECALRGGYFIQTF